MYSYVTIMVTTEDLQPIHQTLCEINKMLCNINEILCKMSLSIETNKRKRGESEPMYDNKRRKMDEWSMMCMTDKF